jgi:putative YphP/YqiW family bacilliredoxin
MFYDPAMTAPMRNELTQLGVQSLESPTQVDEILGDGSKTTLLVVNSVCGCAAANARPGVALAIKHGTQPDNVVTVFAGVDREATEKARSYIKGYMPSSPSMALLKGGEVAFMLQRHEIEGRSPQDIASKLAGAFDEHCAG